VHGSVGNWLILIGVAMIIIGLLVKIGALGWFGQLPGDIQIKRDGLRFYFPLASMILISVVLSLLLSLIRRFL
jgi:Ca2+/Na+ antiporter